MAGKGKSTQKFAKKSGKFFDTLPVVLGLYEGKYFRYVVSHLYPRNQLYTISRAIE